MVTGPQQERLRTALTGATHEVVSAGATEWTRCADLLGIVGAALTRAADAEKDLGGETGPAMGAAFRATATGMAGKATDLRKGSEALALASNAIIAAGVGSSDMNRYFPQEPNPGSYTPPPGPRSDKDLADEAEHTQAVTDFNTSFESRERIAKQWADRIDHSFANSTATMKEIHGERDKTGEGGSGGGGGGPRPISTSPGGTPGRPPSGSPNDPPTGNPTDPPTGNPTDPPIGTPPISTPPISTPPISNPTVPPVVDPWNPALPTAEPSVIGTSGTAPSPAGLPGGATTGAIGGVAAGGLAGAAVGGIRGGFVPSGSASAGAPTTRPIGTSGRTGSSGSLGRGGASSTGSPTTRQSGRAAGRGAGAGGGRGRGAASPGGGAGRRGAAGAGGGGRRGGKDKDEQSGDRDLFDDGQDWIDDAAEAAPGVIG